MLALQTAGITTNSGMHL